MGSVCLDLVNIPGYSSSSRQDFHGQDVLTTA